MKILIVNGPNLNLVGEREPDLYGTTTFNELLESLSTDFPEHSIDYFQSNHCGHLIDKLQSANSEYDGIVLNAGGYTHTSVALGDSAAALRIPLIEVHLTNIFAREPYRHNSYISKSAKTVVCGAGMLSYKWAVEYLVVNFSI